MSKMIRIPNFPEGCDSYLYYYKLTDKTKRLGDGFSSGHSFVEFYNNTSNSITVGYYTLPSHETVTVGLWASNANGGSSSGSSDGSSSGGSSSGSSGSSAITSTYQGVYYNREEYQYNYLEMMCDACQYEITITLDKLAQVTTLLKKQE